MMGKYIGVLSGTSLDSIDVASYQIADNTIETIATSSYELSQEIREACLKLRYNEKTTIADIAKLDVLIGRAFAHAVNEHLKKNQLSPSEFTAIGSHGINVYHQPDAQIPTTMQLGDPNVIAELTGITTTGDFRRRDLAAGGKGAPLAPLFHQRRFYSERENRCIVNIGGICNISLLRPGKAAIGFDLGPGNCLIDDICSEKLNASFDKDAEFARQGKCYNSLLDRLMSDQYFKTPPPKSTGREYFNSKWLSTKLSGFGGISTYDLINTLTNFTAYVISNYVKSLEFDTVVYLCGGGANNPLIMEVIKSLLGKEIYTTEKLGVHHDWVESALFAWLAKGTMNANALDYTKITGAKGARILGGIYQ